MTDTRSGGTVEVMLGSYEGAGAARRPPAPREAESSYRKTPDAQVLYRRSTAASGWRVPAVCTLSRCFGR